MELSLQKVKGHRLYPSREAKQPPKESEEDPKFRYKDYEKFLENICVQVDHIVLRKEPASLFSQNVLRLSRDVTKNLCSYYECFTSVPLALGRCKFCACKYCQLHKDIAVHRCPSAQVVRKRFLIGCLGGYFDDNFQREAMFNMNFYMPEAFSKYLVCTQCKLSWGNTESCRSFEDSFYTDFTDRCQITEVTDDQEADIESKQEHFDSKDDSSDEDDADDQGNDGDDDNTDSDGDSNADDDGDDSSDDTTIYGDSSDEDSSDIDTDTEMDEQANGERPLCSTQSVTSLQDTRTEIKPSDSEEIPDFIPAKSRRSISEIISNLRDNPRGSRIKSNTDHDVPCCSRTFRKYVFRENRSEMYDERTKMYQRVIVKHKSDDYKAKLESKLQTAAITVHNYDTVLEKAMLHIKSWQNLKKMFKNLPTSNTETNAMDANGNGKRGLPKLRNVMRRQRQDFDGCGGDSPDLDFVYDDTDTHTNEIAELYSYTELQELQHNVKAFEDQMEQYGLAPVWQRFQHPVKKSIVMKLLDQLEVSSKPLRMKAARCILYIAQGCWAEVQCDAEQQQWARSNVMLLYEMGVFTAFTDLLNLEIDNSTAAHVAMRKLAVSLVDSQDLRVILSVLYIITEVMRAEKASDCVEYLELVEAFCHELGAPIGDELLAVKLLGMVTRFCSGAAPHFPMKKVLLLLWKIILVTLGGIQTLRDLKAKYREDAGLPVNDEDTMEVAKTMRASSPPASASDLIEAQNQKRNNRPYRRGLIKQSSLDDHESLGMELESGLSDGSDEIVVLTEYDEGRGFESGDPGQGYNYQCRPSTPTPMPLPVPRGLPWKPKVRVKDLDQFLDSSRLKFVGFRLQGDRDSLAGLPQPIHEGVKTLKRHMYTSLAEIQIQKEEEIARNPISLRNENYLLTQTEVLYEAMLPNLPQYMIALLKILLAAAPTSKTKTDSINIMADVLPEEMPMTVLQSMKLGIDVSRHKEIIVKAVSGILLLLLKHFKLNHICQFEFMSQHLVFANCTPLVLKFLNQNIMAYVGAKNVIPILDFPACVIGDQPELTAESLEIGDAAPYSWRNMFSCINLLRILNKLTKWKHSRIMMLVVFKSAPILKRTLKVRHAMTQLYVLKLLKMQTKYLGRQWRKSNMKTISAIYAKVRHRLNDDWAFGNDLDARPWDFQGEECALRVCVDRFNNRRYNIIGRDIDFEPLDNYVNSILGSSLDLSEEFKKNYETWLQQEVFRANINWDVITKP